MRIISRKTLRDFWQKPAYKDAEKPLKAWFKTVAAADWPHAQAIKEVFRSASFVGDNRVVFNIAGNKYRIIVKINYPYRVVYIRFVGTHRQYDAIDAKEM